MKKRTVITSEKREVWIISEGGGNFAIRENTDDEPADTNVSITPAKQNDADATPGEEPLEGS